MKDFWKSRVKSYILYRRQLGFDLKFEAGLLESFAQFAEKHDTHDRLTIDLCIRWAKSSKRQSYWTWERRLATLRGLAKYLRRQDPSNEIPSLGMFGPTRRRLTPHIFTEAELVMLLQSTDHLKSQGGLRAATCRALFGLLSATGLRISEAIGLTQADVDFDNGLLTIRGAKRHYARVIPMHLTVTTALREYASFRDRRMPKKPEASFFIFDNGAPANRRVVLYALRSLCKQLNLLPRSDYRKHRLHDFRHTFVVRSAMQAHRNGVDVDKQILTLSKYVGHVKVADTYWYFTSTPELMSVAAERFYRFAQGGVE
jgi:integrase